MIDGDIAHLKGLPKGMDPEGTVGVIEGVVVSSGFGLGLVEFEQGYFLFGLDAGVGVLRYDIGYDLLSSFGGYPWGFGNRRRFLLL